MGRWEEWDWWALAERAGDYLIFTMMLLLVLLVGTYASENWRQSDDR